MKKTAFILMLITLLSKVLGFGRDITLSYFYGASTISDAYLIAQTVPSVLFGFIGIALTTAYIPMATKIEEEYGLNEENRYTSNLINIVLLILGIIFVISFYYAEYVVKLFASGFYGETLSLAVKFTRISLVGMFFTAMISIYSGFLQIKEDFVTPAIIGFPLNIVTIIAIIISSKGNVNILILGSVIATASQFFIMLPSAHKKGFKYNCVVNFKDEKIKETFIIAMPVILGASVNQVNVLVDRTIASTISIGGISALNYADRLNLFIQGIFVTSIITVIYPYISKMIINDNMEGLKVTIKHSVNIVMICVIPITIGAMFFSEQIISILFGRGAFDINAVKMTASALFFYSIGMIGFGLREVLSRGFYAIQDTRTPMVNASLGMFLNIILNIILSKYMGIGGLALATSISALFTTALLFISLRKKIGGYGLNNITISFFKILIASIFMGIIAYKFYNIMFLSCYNMELSFIGAVSLGILSYAIFIYFMKINEIESIINLLKKNVCYKH